jgi:glycosyltransferase involved in cell wall biosynthesis
MTTLATQPQTEPRVAPKLAVSIVVATYNRAPLLGGVLRTLVAQPVHPRNYEIIVVDNNSRDDTPAVVKDFALRHAGMRYSLQTRQGLSHARNRGWHVARGEYVAFVDDDCEAPQTWLPHAVGIIARRRPAAFGGPYRPLFRSQRPAWFRDAYGANGHGDVARPLGLHEYLSGGNFFVRRDVLGALGGFDPQHGMIGGALGYGEETALQRRLRRELPGEMIYYDPRLVVDHLVRPEKMTLRWAARHQFTSGRFVYRIFDADHGDQSRRRSWFRVGHAALRLCHGLTIGCLLRDRRRYPRYQQYLWECALPQLEPLGRFYESFLRRDDDR